MGLAVDAAVVLQASNHRIKRLRRLLNQRRARMGEGVFVIEGPQIVAEALADRRVEVEGLYLESSGEPLDTDVVGEVAELLAAARGREVPVHRTASGVLARALDTVNPRPVAAVCARPEATTGDLVGDGPVVLVVDGRDPGNIGTVIRSAEASGAAGVVLGGTSVDPTNPKAVRASAGATLRLPVIAALDTGAALDSPALAARPLVALVADGARVVPYDEVDLARAVIAVGNEAHGLPPALVDRADVVATIPLAGPTESLNLAVAASVACFEALRQRRATGPLVSGAGNPVDRSSSTRQV
jgi:TrmH family RNA methyltransferase